MEKKNIDPEDLIFLEEELSKDELTSILFLLYGSDKSEWILGKLRNENNKNYLYDFATHNTCWKTLIVEALTITKLFEMIEKLGIKSSEAREHVSNASITNPGLKLLYQLCEACTKKTTEKLADHIKENCSSARTFSGNALEVCLMHCISDELIRIASSLDGCDFSIVTNFLSENKSEDIEQVLSKFPKRPNTLDSSSNKTFNTVDLTSSLRSVKLSEYQSRRMQVLIINQQTFYRETNPEMKELLPKSPLLERKGTAVDKASLILLFENFGYQVTVKSDLIHSEILIEVKKASQRASLYDGLVICILSHGHEGVVYGHNSIPVRIKDVKSLMASKMVLGKPKILLIQACQGQDLQKESVKKTVTNLEHDGPKQSIIVSGSVYADFLIFWSTIEGFASVRHTEKGTWFIQELVNKINELYKHQHLMDICTAVIKEVSMKRGYTNECMLPKLEATFTKNFRFPPMKNDSSC